MKKWGRRCLFSLGLLLAAGLLLLVIGVSLFRAIPAWYVPLDKPAEQREQLAQAAENKLIDAHNWAAELRADAVRTARAERAGSTAPATRAAASHIVDFTQDELNALFAKWSVMYGWTRSYAQFVENPTLVLHDGRIILAGKVKDLGAIASVHLQPSLDANGKLRLELSKVRGGKLPLPQSFWTKWRDQASASIRRQLPRWQAQSRIAPSGGANTPAMTAAMGKLFLAAAANQPAEPVLFLPLMEGGESVPVKVRDVVIDEGRISLAVEPLTSTERAGLLEQIKSPQN